jgi:ribosomal protein S18 acetylase RimI-like enzyme
LNLLLRPVRTEDVPFLAKLYASTRETEMALVDWSEAQKTAFLNMQFDAQHRYYTEMYSDAHFDVIESGGVPVGRLYVDYRPEAIHVIDIALLPDYRGLGLGKQIMQDLLRQGENEGLQVTIHVEQFNPALRFYQRLGFEMLQGEGIHFLMRWVPQSVADSIAN